MKAIRTNDLSYIGFISKPHGFRGEVIVAAEETDPEELLDLDYFFLQPEGLPVPFRVTESRLKSGQLIVAFEDVDTELKARKLSGLEVFIDADLLEDETVDYSRLTGYTVLDERHGELGVIEGIEEYPMQLIARCNRNGRELLFPLNESIVTQIHPAEKTVTVILPDGLLEVYE